MTEADKNMIDALLATNRDLTISNKKLLGFVRTATKKKGFPTGTIQMFAQNLLEEIENDRQIRDIGGATKDSGPVALPRTQGGHAPEVSAHQ